MNAFMRRKKESEQKKLDRAKEARERRAIRAFRAQQFAESVMESVHENLDSIRTGSDEDYDPLDPRYLKTLPRVFKKITSH